MFQPKTIKGFNVVVDSPRLSTPLIGPCIGLTLIKLKHVMIYYIYRLYFSVLSMFKNLMTISLPHSDTGKT